MADIVQLFDPELTSSAGRDPDLERWESLYLGQTKREISFPESKDPQFGMDRAV